MRRGASGLLRWALMVFAAGAVLEFFLAGLGIFRTQGQATKVGYVLTKTRFDHYFDPHLVVGDVLVLIAIAILVLALIARSPRRIARQTWLLLIVVLLQASMPFAGPASLRALHPVLGLAVLGLTAAMVKDLWSPSLRANRNRP